MRKRRRAESHKPLGNVSVAFNSAAQGTVRKLVDANTGAVTYVADGRIAKRIMEKRRKQVTQAVEAATARQIDITL